MRRVRLAGVLATLLVGSILVVPGTAAAQDDVVAVPNGGFEEAVVDGAIPGWRQTFGSTPAFAVVDTPAYAGGHSVQLDDPSGTDSAGLQSDRFPITGGRTYELTAQVYRTVGFTSLFLYFYDDAGVQLAQHVQDFQTAVDSWQPVAVTATAPAGATQAAILLYSSSVVVTRAYFDEVSVAAADPVPELVNLGAPINNVAIDKVTYGTSPDGRPILYTVLLGSGTTHLHVVDLRERRSIKRVQLPHAFGARDLAVAPDGSLYLATFAQGRLYRYDLVSDTLTDLGRPAADAQYLFGLAIHPDGTVFAGAYPTGRLYGYDPATGDYRDYGQLAADSQYLRGIQVHGDSLVIGLGTQRARLVEVDIETGAVTPIPLPAPYADEHEVNQVTVRRDVAYVHLTASRTMLRYDLDDRSWLAPLGTATGLDVSPISPIRAEIYYGGTDGLLHATSTVTGRTRDIPAFSGMWTSRGFAWVALREHGFPGESLVMTDYIGRLWVYNPRTGNSRVDLLDILGEPTSIRSIGLGPDGKVWAGGLGSGGLSSYDPATGAMAQVPRGTVGQTDEMLAVGGDLYLGTYPTATILRYDPASPFDWGNNPRSVANLAGEGQDRPMALAEASGKLVIGTVPDYGQLSGAISVYDLATGELSVDRGAAGTSSVVSMVSDGTTIYASTSKWGGLGIEPAPADGTVFAYDPVAGSKLWEVTPFPGLPAITELVWSPAGTIWGLTRGRLFELDPATRQVVRSIAVPEENWDTVDHVWSEGQRLAVSPDGTVYATVGGELLRVDPDTGTVTELANGVFALLLVGSDLYVTRGAELYRLTLPAAEAS